MNKLKKISVLIAYLFIVFLNLGCSKNYYYSGVSEDIYNDIYENYKSNNFSKEYISDLIGQPLVKDNGMNLWIYQISKKSGNATFKKAVYNKNIKLYFEDNILINIAETNF